MSKLIFQAMITLDGFFEGPNREIDWHIVDEEFNHYAIEMLDDAEILLFGRITYQLMESYWPAPEAISNDPVVAAKMNSLRKVVVSRSLEKADWNNSVLLKENVPAEINRLKKQAKKNLVIFGGSDLALSLIGHRLIDEFRIIINPVLLGSGKRLFQGLEERLKLVLLHSKGFKSGNTMNTYRQRAE
jgi:dihydrofolate reductase